MKCTEYENNEPIRKGKTVSQSFRSPKIMELARRDGKVTVEGLADHFGVTVQTIRRDLRDLSDSGALDKVHGGAVMPSGIFNIKYNDRIELNYISKVLIAKMCAKNIPNDNAIFLNIGTTTEAVARELIGHKKLLVITNNLNVANILRDNQECEIVITGGNLRRSDGGLIGDAAVEIISRFKFDIAVIGCSAVDQDGDMLDYDMQEIIVSQNIIKQSRKIFLVADSTKFSRKAPIKIASLSEVDCIFTDKPLDKSLQDACLAWNTEIRSTS